MAQVDIVVRQGDDVVVDSTESRFQLASVSKQFTAAAVLLLVEEGTLLLEDPISRWIDGCPEQWRDITLHHLLSHTSGLGHWDDYPMIDLGQRVEPSELLKTFHSVVRGAQQYRGDHPQHPGAAAHLTAGRRETRPYEGYGGPVRR